MAAGVLDIIIKFKIGAREKSLSYRKIPMWAWKELYDATKITQTTLPSEIGQFNPDAIAALFWLERKQRERRLTFADVRQEVLRYSADWEELELTDIIADGKSMFDEDTETTEETDDDADFHSAAV